MNCRLDKSKLVGFFSSELSEKDKTQVAQHVAVCKDCQKDLEQIRALHEEIASQPIHEPPGAIREEFNRMLFSEMELEYSRGQRGLKRYWDDAIRVILQPTLMKVCGVTILMFGSFFLGGYFHSQSDHGQAVSEDQMARLENEVEHLKGLYLSNSLLLKKPSHRLQALTQFTTVDNLSDTMQSALLRFIQDDQNLNIRLTAIEKISGFADQPQVMDQLLDCFETEDKALMQVALIQLFVEQRETRSIPLLQQKLLDPEIPDYVKRFALEALQFFAGEDQNKKTNDII